MSDYVGLVYLGHLHLGHVFSQRGSKEWQQLSGLRNSHQLERGGGREGHLWQQNGASPGVLKMTKRGYKKLTQTLGTRHGDVHIVHHLAGQDMPLDIIPPVNVSHIPARLSIKYD